MQEYEMQVENLSQNYRAINNRHPNSLGAKKVSNTNFRRTNKAS